jgi:hypothetical protein
MPQSGRQGGQTRKVERGEGRVDDGLFDGVWKSTLVELSVSVSELSSL